MNQEVQNKETKDENINVEDSAETSQENLNTDESIQAENESADISNNKDSENNKEEELQTKLEEKDQQITELKESLLRQHADLENFKRRQLETSREQLKYASQKLITSLLPSLDNLDRALIHLREQKTVNDTTATFIEGIEMVQKSLLQTLEKEEVKLLHPVGEVFNPEQHEAISLSDNTEYENDTVVEVVQKGYSYHERILRPAMVIVAKH